MKREINNQQDIMDSRDMIEQLEEWQNEWESLVVDVDEAENDEDKAKAQAALDEWNADYGDDYKALKEFCEEAEGYASDWKYGETVIRDSYFTDYAEELCKDIGDMPKELPWYIANHIDWDGVADELKADYTSIDYDGVTYWVRST